MILLKINCFLSFWRFFCKKLQNPVCCTVLPWAADSVTKMFIFEETAFLSFSSNYIIRNGGVRLGNTKFLVMRIDGSTINKFFLFFWNFFFTSRFCLKSATGDSVTEMFIPEKTTFLAFSSNYIIRNGSLVVRSD